MSVDCGDQSTYVTSLNESHRIVDDGDCIELRDPGPEEDKSADSQRARSPFKAMFGEVSIIRDFFLAAFSDGYNSVCKLFLFC